MPDHSKTIQQLKAILNSGTTSGTVDGQAVSFQTTDELRTRIQELQRQDTSTRRRRFRRFTPIDLSRSW